MKLEQALRQYYNFCVAARDSHMKSGDEKQVEYFSLIIMALQTVAFLGETNLNQDQKKES